MSNSFGVPGVVTGTSGQKNFSMRAQCPAGEESHGAVILTEPAEYLLSLIRLMGGDTREVIERAGLTRNVDDIAPLVIPLGAFVSLTQHAARTLSCPEFGWTAGQSYDLTSLGPIGHAMLTAETAGVALQLLCDALHAVQNVSRLTLAIENDSAVVRYRILDPTIWPRNQDAELTLAVVTRLIRISAGNTWRPDKLMFEHDLPEGLVTAECRAKSKTLYGAETNEMHFPAAVLQAPMPGRSFEQFSQHCFAVNRLKHTIAAQMSLPCRVRQQFYLRFGSGSIDQSDVASELGMSRRSLRRQLANYGTSYSRELAECRHEYTKLQLLNTTLTIADIAYELGYSDQTAFERAFRRATGETPTLYRRKAFGLTPAA